MPRKFRPPSKAQQPFRIVRAVRDARKVTLIYVWDGPPKEGCEHRPGRGRSRDKTQPFVFPSTKQAERLARAINIRQPISWPQARTMIGEHGGQ